MRMNRYCNTNIKIYNYILPSYWFSLSAIDQYSSLLYIKALGFFQTQCGRSTFQLRLRFIARKVITFPTTHRDKNFHLKADITLTFGYKGFFPLL